MILRSYFDDLLTVVGYPQKVQWPVDHTFALAYTDEADTRKGTDSMTPKTSKVRPQYSFAKRVLAFTVVIALLGGFAPSTRAMADRPEASGQARPERPTESDSVLSSGVSSNPIAVSRSNAGPDDEEDVSLGLQATVQAAVGSIWTIETVDDAGDAGRYSSMAIAADGTLHVSYYEQGGGDLRYARSGGSSWITETVDGVGNVGQYSSLDLDTSAYPHIAYYSVDDGALKYVHWNGLSWAVTTVDNAGDVGQYASLAVDANDVPHISYYSATGLGNLKYAHLDGASWVSTTVDTIPATGQYTSLALESDLYPRISYQYDLEKQLKYASLTGSTWANAAVNGPGEGGAHTSLVLDADGYPHVSFLDDWAGNSLVYAAYNGSSWVSMTVAGGAGFVTRPSLALDASGHPHIAYFDNIYYALRYATYDGSSWHIETVDNTAYVEAYPSLVLDSAGYPHISYYHQVDGLKHAWLHPCAAPQVVDISGPSTVISGTGGVFTATVYPPTATLPITYTWLFPGGDGSEVALSSTDSTMLVPAPISGTHTITVTAQNCGGSSSSTREVQIDDPRLPDLVVTDAWDEENAIWYQVTNQGNLTVTASYLVSLSIDGSGETEEVVDVVLGPSVSFLRAFPFYTYACSGNDDVVQVTVDAGSAVVERDETNNAFQTTWFCDQQPPIFTEGPVVSLVTEDSATIEWMTDDPSDTGVQYGATAGGYDAFEHDPADVTGHSITLNGLAPSTVYHYRAQSTDPNGYQSVSDEFFFETLPATSAPPPTPQVVVDPVEGNPDLFEIHAIYTATTDIDYVAFFIDGQAVGTDYADDDGQFSYLMSPYSLGFSRDGFYGSTHSVEARAYTFDNSLFLNPTIFYPDHETPPAEVEIISPPSNRTIYIDGDVAPAGTQVSILARAVEYEWACEWLDTGTRVKEPNCADVEKPVDTVQFLVDNRVVHTSSGGLTHLYTLDLSGLSPSMHIVRVRAITTDGRKLETQTTIYLQKIVREPILNVSRNFTREGNYFRVQLTVENDARATGDAQVKRIRDYVAGLQVVPKTTTGYEVSASYHYWAGSTTRQNSIIIDLDQASSVYTLSPGESFTVEYLLVPIMYETSADYRIGGMGQDIQVFFDNPAGQAVMRGFDRRVWGLNHQVYLVLDQADYVLVTHPENLAFNYGDVNELLGTMAHLATLKHGALGYLESNITTGALRDLIVPGGRWAASLHPNFSTTGKGYMLIVGEVEIVPAWTITGLNVKWSNGPTTHEVPLSDHQYANTRGKVGSPPELVVGRIIGDSMGALLKPLQASIGVYEGMPGYSFDRSHAALVSSTGKEIRDFVSDVNQLANILQPTVSVNKHHWRDDLMLGSFACTYTQYDGLAVGDVNGDGVDEIVVARQGSYIHILDAQGNEIGSFSPDAWTKFEAGDRLAVGDVTGDGKAEIIVSDHSADHIYVYDQSGTELTKFRRWIAAFDGLAAGNVNGIGKDEIVFADQTSIYIYDVNGTLLNDFQHQGSFSRDIGLAIGDLVGDGRDEIISGSQWLQRISVHDENGALLHWFEAKLYAGYDIAAGSTMFFYPKDQVIVAEQRNLRIYRYNLTDHIWDNWEVPNASSLSSGMAVVDVMGNSLQEILVADPLFDVVQITDPYYHGRMDASFRAMMPGSDIVNYRGHGNTTVWSPGLSAQEVAGVNLLNFGGSTPVVLATTCLSGDYQSAKDDRSIAEAFLDSGAAVYIGSTQVSAHSANPSAAKWYLKNWDTDETAGETLTSLERRQWGESKAWNLWVYEYNLYGDPKFGTDTSTLGSSMATAYAAAEAVPSELYVTVPDYEVTSVDGFDHVEIPDGQIWQEDGAYMIPYWSVSVEYPAGQRVQDVALVGQTGAMTDTGLNIPVGVMVTDSLQTDGLHSVVSQDTVLPLSADWVPGVPAPYEWTLSENADGSTPLVARMYPFRYRPLTTDVEFTKNYTFAIESITSTMAVDWLETDMDVYTQGLPVHVDLWLENTGTAQDVIVEATIRRGTSDELVEGLPLHILDDLAGEASLALEWDSSGFETGDYYVDIALRDLEGNLLDRDSQPFRLGIVQGQVTALTATPDLFKVGDTIDISMTLNNLGTVPLTGTAIVQVQTADGSAIVDTFTHDVAALQPASTVMLNDVWNTSGVTESDYRIVGYLLYDSTATPPETATIGTRTRVYLPLVIRDYP